MTGVASSLALGTLALALGACAEASDPGSPQGSASLPSTAVAASASGLAPSREVIRPLVSHPSSDPKEKRWIEDGGHSGCSLALDAEAVYWADSYNAVIRRVAKASGEMTIVADKQGKPSSLAVDDRHAFWLAGATGRLRRAPKSGGAFGGLAAEVSNPVQLAIDETDVYFTRNTTPPSQDDPVVLRVPKGGGEAVVVTGWPGGREPKVVALDAEHVYFGQTTLLRVAKKGGQAERLRSDRSEIRALAVDDRFIFFIAGEQSWDGVLYRMPKTGGVPTTLYKPGEKEQDGSPLAFAIDASDVFFVDRTGAVKRIPKTGGEAHKLAQISQYGAGIALDETSLWVCGEHGLWQLSWAPIAGAPRAFPTHGPAVPFFAFDRQGQLIGADYEGKIRAYDVTTGLTAKEVAVERSIRGMALGADGQTIVVTDFDGGLEGWDFTSAKRKWFNRSEERQKVSTEVFAASPDGSLVLYRRARQTLRLFSSETGDEVRNLHQHTKTPSAIAIAPDNSFFLTAPERPGRKGTPPPIAKGEPPLRLWDMRTGKQIAAFSGEAEPLFALAVSGDGKLAISGGDWGLIRIWDIASRSMTLSLQAEGPIVGVAFSRSAERALTVSPGEGACLWDLKAKKRLGCSPHRARQPWSVPIPVQVVFSPAEDEAWWTTHHGYLRWKLPVP